jgi:hypothetical protein
MILAVVAARVGCAMISSLQATRLPLQQLCFQIDLRAGESDGDRASPFR